MPKGNFLILKIEIEPDIWWILNFKVIFNDNSVHYPWKIFFGNKTTTLLFVFFNALQFHFIKLSPIFVGSALCQFLKHQDFLWTCSVLAWNLTIFEFCCWKPFDPTPISTCTYLLCYDSMKKMRSVERNFMFPWVASKKTPTD